MSAQGPGEGLDAVVVGGGIGGLAAALAVARAGMRVLVLERAERFAEIGAGIQIAPNGLHALDRLGVGDEVRSLAVHMSELRFMDGVTGEHVTSVPLTEGYRRRFGNPYVVVHRAELHAALLAACRSDPAVELRSGCAVAGYENGPATATVRTAAGERLTARIVIGADGLHSAIRRQLVGDGEPRVSGITVYRAVVPMERVPEAERLLTAVTWWAGPGCHFVHYPIAGGKYLNMAASSADGATEALAGVPATQALVEREMKALGEGAQRLMALGEDWRSWVLVDRPPVPGWTDGRTTLLGDAAHPMLHYAAQGACQSLEDAVVLGDLLERGDAELPALLAEYNARRRRRTAEIQDVSRLSIGLWHPSDEAAKERNRALAALSPEQLHGHLAWMHGARDFTDTDTAPVRDGAST
ncbi:FAD-dependent monooxygenase [Streptomyces xiaopingdaonensis]|uniref:FAD-dependent monooxygenase n=1 Tax=Streptomyces xiaopingdaonensis TaxID=1565415 RepID=UPI00030210E3|nr:FAD-dependent monooxygenase [Streptomyces xiaopingdaonensis]